MNHLLNQFWIWLGQTPETYAKEGTSRSGDECDFPCYQELMTGAMKIVDENKTNDNAIDNLLTIMAIDNETEQILEYIENKSTDEQLEIIIRKGIYHMQPEARWQLAELIYRRRPFGYIEYLKVLAKDEHPYVRKRANNCISYLEEGK